MVLPEDVEGNLLPALEEVSPLKGKRVLDLGTGTGRLPLLFGAQTAQMVGLDLHWDMLREQNEQRQKQDGAWGYVIFLCGTITGNNVVGEPVNDNCASDPTPPVITYNVSGTEGNNGWYTDDVTVSWTVTDGESTISSTSGCESTTISSDTAGATLTCTATSDGGTDEVSVTIKRDATAPTISGSAAPGPNANGWNNTDVTVSFHPR